MSKLQATPCPDGKKIGIAHALLYLCHAFLYQGSCEFINNSVVDIHARSSFDHHLVNSKEQKSRSKS
jgi:hypothetical protein